MGRTQPAKTPSRESMREHPLFLGAAAIAATSLFWLAVFNQFALPTFTRDVQNQLAEVKKKSAQLEARIKSESEKSSSRIRRLEQANKEVASQLRRSEALLASLPLQDFFTRDNPIPKGYREVDVGVDINRVLDVYKSIAKSITKKPGWYSVSFARGPFSDATYYRLRDNDDASPVSHILFFPKDSSEKGLQGLSAALESTYGAKMSAEDRFGDEEYRWFNVGRWGRDGSYDIKFSPRTGSFLVDLSCPTWRKIYKYSEADMPCALPKNSEPGPAGKSKGQGANPLPR